MTPAIQALKKAGCPHRVLAYEHDPKSASYGLEAVERLGLSADQTFKTLLVQTDAHELLVAVVPVSHSLNLKALAHAAGVKKVEMAAPADAQRATGYLVGGISPLGQKKKLRSFLDESARALPVIFVSAGRRGLEVELEPQALTDLVGAQFTALSA